MKLPQDKEVSYKDSRENLQDTSGIKQGVSKVLLNETIEAMYAEMLDFIALWLTSKQSNGVQITPEEFIHCLKAALKEEGSYYKRNADRCSAVLELMKDIDN